MTEALKDAILNYAAVSDGSIAEGCWKEIEAQVEAYALQRIEEWMDMADWSAVLAMRAKKVVVKKMVTAEAAAEAAAVATRAAEASAAVAAVTTRAAAASAAAEAALKAQRVAERKAI